MPKSIELKEEDIPDRFRQMGGVPNMWGLAAELTPKPGYAGMRIDQAFFGYGALLRRLAAMRPGNAERAVITAYYGHRKSGLTPEGAYALEFHDVRAFDVAIGKGALSYSRGDVLDPEEVTDAMPYGIGFAATSMSSCIFPDEITSARSAADPIHREAVFSAREWFDAAAIVQAQPRLIRDAGGAIASASLKVVSVRTLFS